MVIQSPRIDQTVLVLRVIYAGLLGGLLMFAALAIWLVTARDFAAEATEGIPFLQAALVVLWAGAAGAQLFVRKVAVARLRPRVDTADSEAEVTEQVLDDYTRMAILQGALIEGPTLFAVVVYLIGGSLIALSLAALGAVVLVALVPSRDRLRAFVRDVRGLPG